MTELPPSLRRALVLGPTLLLVGVVSALGDESTFAGAVTVLGFFISAAALHRLGRQGPSRGPSSLAPEHNDSDIVS